MFECLEFADCKYSLTQAVLEERCCICLANDVLEVALSGPLCISKPMTTTAFFDVKIVITITIIKLQAGLEP